MKKDVEFVAYETIGSVLYNPRILDVPIHDFTRKRKVCDRCASMYGRTEFWCPHDPLGMIEGNVPLKCKYALEHMMDEK